MGDRLVAGVQTYLRNLALRVAYDATEVARGVDQTENDLASLERSTAASADSIDDSLSQVGDTASTTFDQGGDFDRALTDAEGTATSKGAAIGQGVSQGVEEGIQTGDWGGAIQNTLSSVAGALPGIGLAVGIGASLATGVFLGMKRAADQRRQEFVDAVNKAFQQIEVRAKQSTKSINQAYLETLTFKDTLAQLGGGDESAGFSLVARQAETLGVNVEDVINLINGQLTPGALVLRDHMADVAANMKNSGQAIREANGVLSEQQQTAATIAGWIDVQNKKHDLTVDMLIAERDAARDIAGYQAGAAGSAEAMAAAAERYAAAIGRAAARRLPTSIGG